MNTLKKLRYKASRTALRLPKAWWEHRGLNDKDVMFASFERSGNTWLRAILATLVSGRAVDINAMAFLGPHAASRSRFDRALGIDSASLSDAQGFNLRPRVYEILAAEAEQPLYCKTHGACLATPAGEPLFPTAATRGAVYVVRDPRAVAVSSVHFMAWRRCCNWCS